VSEGRISLWTIWALVLLAEPASAQFMNDAAPEVAAPMLRASDPEQPSWTHMLGDFRVAWLASGPDGARLTISAANDEQRVYWQSQPGAGFVLAAGASVTAEPRTGYSHMIENTTLECDAHTVDADSLSSGILTITGELSCGEIGAVPYELLLTQADVGQLQMRLRVSHSSIGRTGLAFASSGDERVFGFGEQYSAFDFKGSRIPIMVDEQGLSRGAQPLTDWFDERSISGWRMVFNLRANSPLHHHGNTFSDAGKCRIFGVRSAPGRSDCDADLCQ